VKWIDYAVHDVAEQVTDGGGSDNGYEEIGSGADAVAGQRIAERTRTMRQSGLAGHVDHAADAHRRIGHEPNRGRASAGGAQLEHVVENDHRLTEVDQDVVKGLANGARRQGVIDGAKDSYASPCQRHLDGETSAIDPLERIVWRRRRGRSAGISDTDRHHSHGRDQR
jgi:hypothetical protein